MVKLLSETKKNMDNINICKSSSKISGYILRRAHYELGFELGKKICKDENIIDKNINIYVLMRAGLLFALGIGDAMETDGCNVNFSFSSINNILCGSSDLIILTDAVINTGSTILKLISSINKEKVRIATNVISNEGCEAMENYIVYASRISTNSYKGSKQSFIINNKGPDTGDRLFDSCFFKINNDK